MLALQWLYVDAPTRREVFGINFDYIHDELQALVRFPEEDNAVITKCEGDNPCIGSAQLRRSADDKTLEVSLSSVVVTPRDGFPDPRLPVPASGELLAEPGMTACHLTSA